MLFEPDLTPPPLTRTEKLSRKIENMIDRYHEGNSWKVGSMLLTVPGILGIALGGGLGLPPLVAMLFVTSTVSAITTTVSYAFVESSELGTKPLFLPYSGEDVAGNLPEKEMYHWQAIRYMGFEVVEAIELWGKLDLLIDHVKFINMIDVPDDVYERVYIKKMVDIKTLFTSAKPTDNPPKLNRTRAVFAPSPTEMTEYDRSPSLIATADNLPPVRDLARTIADLDTHALIVAKSRAGKTTLLTQIIELAQESGQVFLWDGKGDPRLKVAGSYRVANTTDRAIESLDALETLMATLTTRQDLTLKQGHSDFTRFTIVFDELNLIRLALLEEKEALGFLTRSLIRLATQGASVGIHLILTSHTSRLNSLGFDGSIKDCFSFISLGRNNAYESIEDTLDNQISGRKARALQEQLDSIRELSFSETLALSTIGKVEFIRLPLVDRTATAFTPKPELDIRSSLDRLYQSATAPEPQTKQFTPTPKPTLESPLKEIFEYAKTQELVKARDIQNNVTGCKKIPLDEIRSYFHQLEEMEFGYTEGEGSTLSFSVYSQPCR